MNFQDSQFLGIPLRLSSELCCQTLFVVKALEILVSGVQLEVANITIDAP
jgi:hypothetical protein